MKTNTFITLSTATANIGVLVGLVFLIFELRQTSSIAQSEIRQDRSNAMIEEFSQIYSEDSVLSVHMALMEGDFEAITGLEKERLFWFERVRYQRFEDVYYQWEKGLIDESAFQESMNFAAIRKDLWHWLDIPMPNRAMNEAVDQLRSSPSFNLKPWAIRFFDWLKSKDA